MTEHFSFSEMCCRHCRNWRDIRDNWENLRYGRVWSRVHRTAGLLEKVRAIVRRPLVVTSALRCSHHPEETAKPPGSLHRHTSGRAVDIRAQGDRRLELLFAARKAGFRSFGIYPQFLHVDWCDGPEYRRLWVGG